MGSDKGDAVDLQLRWTEERYFLRANNPFDVWARRSPRAAQNGISDNSGRSSHFESDLGLPDPAHPPWGYITGLIYLWPSWPMVRFYYAAFNLVILAGLTVGFYIAARPLGSPIALLVALGVPAMQGVGLTLQVGQYGIIVTGFLAGCLAFLIRGKQVPAGLLLGLALVKPTISAPFFLALLCRGYFLACATTLAYCAGASLIVWGILDTNPLELVQQLHACGSTYAGEGGFGPLRLLLSAGAEPRVAVGAVSFFSILALFVGLLACSKRLSTVDAFALAAVVGRLWTYHRNYDNLMVVFVALALVDRLCRARVSPSIIVALLLVAISLWVPSRFLDSLALQVLQHLIWLAAAVVLVVQPTSSQADVSALSDAFPIPSKSSDVSLTTSPGT
jgi:hypothetical protein